MSEKADWEAIRREYENSDIPYRSLAVKYGVPPATLYSRSRKWNQASSIKQKNQASSIRQEVSTQSIHILRNEFPSPPSAIKIANLGLEALAEILEENNRKKNENGERKMDLADHVRAANALSQYNRVIVNAVPPENEEQEDDSDIITIDTRDLSAEKLAKLKAFALEMKESEDVG